MVNRETPTIVFDVGARYGPHPSFSHFLAPIHYLLIEADPSEADRLERNYPTDAVEVINAAVVPVADEASKTLRVTTNAAMSSLFSRSDVSPLYRQGSVRRNQTEVVSELCVNTVTLDECARRFGNPHFVKVDIEGGERDILLSSDVATNAIAIRSEVTFLEVFQDGTGAAGSFAAIHAGLVERGFMLLNLDYDGRGDASSKFVSATQRYGQLQSTDAVWVRPIEPLLNSPPTVLDGLRGIVFLMHNSAPDVAIDLLSSFTLKKLAAEEAPLLWSHLSDLVARHLYSIKWDPAQSVRDHKTLWESMFERDYPEMHQYNNSPRLNPNIDLWKQRQFET